MSIFDLKREHGIEIVVLLWDGIATISIASNAIVLSSVAFSAIALSSISSSTIARSAISPSGSITSVLFRRPKYDQTTIEMWGQLTDGGQKLRDVALVYSDVECARGVLMQLSGVLCEGNEVIESMSGIDLEGFCGGNKRGRRAGGSGCGEGLEDGGWIGGGCVDDERELRRGEG